MWTKIAALFKDHKFMRRVMLFWWMGLFTYISIYMVHTEQMTSTSYNILAGVSTVMFGYYFYVRAVEK